MSRFRRLQNRKLSLQKKRSSPLLTNHPPLRAGEYGDKWLARGGMERCRLPWIWWGRVELGVGTLLHIGFDSRDLGLDPE